MFYNRRYQVYDSKNVSSARKYFDIWTCSKKLALRDIAKIKKSQFFYKVLFENEASYEDFFLPTGVLSYVTDTFRNIFSQNLI